MAVYSKKISRLTKYLLIANFALLVGILPAYFTTITAQQLGVYVAPNDALDNSFELVSNGFDAVLVKADKANLSTQPVIKFAYPWLNFSELSTDEQIEQTFITRASTTFSAFEFVSFHPAQLIEAEKPLNYSFDKFYSERVLSYLKIAEEIPANKKAWLIMSFLDYPYAAEQINKNENLDAEAIIFKAYQAEDYEVRKIERLIELAQQMKIKWVFLDQHFLQEAIEMNPSLPIYLRSVQNAQELAIQPLAYSRTVSYNQFGSILIIVFVSLFVIHFTISFRYQRALKRYFTNTRFFLQDVKSWRNSITFSAFFVLFKFIGLHALVQAALLSLIISPDGFSLLNNSLGIFSFTVISPFLNTFFNLIVINTLFHILLLIWAQLVNKGLYYFGQVGSVYTYGMHFLFLLLIPTYLLVGNLPQSFWFISLTAFALLLLLPLNHLRAQISMASIDSSGIVWSIGLGYILFWFLFVGILFLTQLQFDWLNTFRLAIAIP